MDSLFLNFGLSWTWSKILPYLFFILLGVFIFRFVRRRFEKKIYQILSSLLIPIPFLLYFMIYPIYEGDFSNHWESHKFIQGSIEPKRLTVIAIPGCPFCYQSIDDLIRMKERTGVETIDFIVLTDDPQYLDWYKEEAGGELNIISSSHSYLPELANQQYPAFAYGDGETVKVWSNDSFGVTAKDHLEDILGGESEF